MHTLVWEAQASRPCKGAGRAPVFCLRKLKPPCPQDCKVWRVKLCRCTLQAVPEEAAHGPGLRYIVNVTTTNGPIPSREPLYYLETNFTQAAVSLDDLGLGGGGVLYVKAVNEAGPGQDEAALRFAPSVGKWLLSFLFNSP